jgi:hypothetical protein
METTYYCVQATIKPCGFLCHLLRSADKAGREKFGQRLLELLTPLTGEKLSVSLSALVVLNIEQYTKKVI